jgi:hypothetical protein
MSSGHFRDLCLSFLDEEDRAQLDRCTLDIPKTPPSALPPAPGEPAALTSSFIIDWREWERSLRLNLVRFRSQRLKREASSLEVPEYPADAVDAAKAASALDSPLDAEILLDKARWDAIERFRGLDNFGSAFIFAYLLKLLLMERRTSFKTEEGFMEYKTLYTAIVENYSGTESGVPK